MYLISGEGGRYRHSHDERMLSELSPVELIRRGLEKLERSSSEVVVVAPENLPSPLASEFAAVALFPLAELSKTAIDPTQVQGYIMAYRQWLPNPSQTVGVRMTDDSMNPILPAGSIAAIDRSMTDPLQLHGRIVAACPDGVPVIRWLEVSGRHMILRPNQQSREYPLVPVDLEDAGAAMILGQVVWSWSRFSDD